MQRVCARKVLHGLIAGTAALVLIVGCGDDGEGNGPRAPTPSPTPQRGENVPRPLVEGPVTGGRGQPFFAGTTFDPSVLGYEQAEYFFSGTARAFTNLAPLQRDGRWRAAPSGTTAAYKSRIVVFRPIDPADFNGTVIVEWLNVSGGLDAAPDWINAHTELMREGYGWAGVSAQLVGIEGTTSVLGSPLGLKSVDPDRYGSLAHPGDSFSYDIYSQAAQAVRRPTGANPFPGFEVETLIAAGESQSAFRMVTYVNAIHPLAGIYDGFLVHSRGGGAAPLSQDPQPAIPAPAPAFTRDDVDVPVLTFQTETDMTTLGYFPARQPDSRNFRLWEVAGTAHVDTYIGTGMSDLGNSPDVARIVLTTAPIPGPACSTPVNSGPQHFVLKAAFAALYRWVRQGVAPPSAPRLEMDPGPPPTIRRDARGNALGGIRTPQLDAPIATLSGEGQAGGGFCGLFGTTVLFDGATLAELYPDQAAYVNAFNAATDRAVAAGYILPPDAELMKAAAADTDIGG